MSVWSLKYVQFEAIFRLFAVKRHNSVNTLTFSQPLTVQNLVFVLS